jgi:hypothetical protein
MIMDHERSDTDRENRYVWRKVCPTSTLFTTNTIRSVLESKEVLGGERPATNLLSHGTVQLSDKWQISTILYSFPCILHSAFPRHLLEIRVYGRNKSSRLSLSTFPGFYQRTSNYRGTENAQLDATKLGSFHILLLWDCQNEKCSQGVKSFTWMLDSKKIFAVYI